MSDEKPVPVKKLKTVADLEFGDLTCIIHYSTDNQDQEVKKLTDESIASITNAANVRQAQRKGSSARLDEICCKIPDMYDRNIHGFHRKCYQKCTNVSRLSVDSDETQTDVNAADSRKSGRKASSSVSTCQLFPQDQCLFCPLTKKIRRGVVEPLSRCETDDGEARIKAAAKEKNDYVMLGKIDGVDLQAKEARFHGSCRREYTRIEDSRRSVDVTDEELLKANKKNAFDEAFEVIVKYVNDNILVREGVIVRMSMLKERYLGYILEHFPIHYNPNHKTCKLKDRLVSYFADKIRFRLPHYGSELVFSSEINVGDVVEVAYEAMLMKFLKMKSKRTMRSITS